MRASRQAWLASALGQYFLAQEQALFDAAVADIFGFKALQIGFSDVDFLSNSRIPTLLHVDELVNAMSSDVICESGALPLEVDSVDLVLLPHVLEFSDNPHQTLREVERILMYEGYVILTGFNPISSWGLKRFFTKKQDAASVDFPWQGQFFSQTRIKDWLALLGLEFMSVTNCCYSLPRNHSAWLNRFQFLDKFGKRCWPMMGGVYFIVAKKRVAGMTLLKPNWKKAPIKSRLAISSPQKTDRQKVNLNHHVEPNE